MSATNSKWHPFSQAKGYRQKRPPIGKYVLVKLWAQASFRSGGIAVGYRKDAAGCEDSPFFVIPGIGGEAAAWCDCLPDNFVWLQEARDA